MIRALPGVSRSDQTGNPFQPNIDYRGFTASPVPGTPQGLAVYQNGARINETFGDTVNWDLIPQMAINRMTLSPNNPVYGLNALGGAISIEMKNGFNYQGAQAEVTGGSFGRIGASAQAGGQRGMCRVTSRPTVYTTPVGVTFRPRSNCTECILIWVREVTRPNFISPLWERTIN